jgi:hypothetical protein
MRIACAQSRKYLNCVTPYLQCYGMSQHQWLVHTPKEKMLHKKCIDGENWIRIDIDTVYMCE